MSSPTASTPIVLLLSLQKESYWDDQYSVFVDLLSSKATIKRVTKIQPAINFLANNTPSAIIITDSALTERDSKFDVIRQATVSYVRAGGKAIIGTHSTTFVKPLDMNHWFSNTWDLPWENGDYHRTTVHLELGACEGYFDQHNLPKQYSQKAVFLKNVAREAAVYLPSSQSGTESHVFAPAAIDGRQTPVAFVRIWKGWLGYVGDVNNESESHTVILAMCGL